MRPHHLRLGRAAVVAVGALFATTFVAMAALSPGVTVEDQAGALPGGAASSIQSEAAPFTSASIPVLVVIRRQASTADGVVQEAQDLMRAQSVESATGGSDGIVVLLDIDPAGGAQGRGSIAVGQRLSSALPAPTLSSIYTQSMVPLLRNGDFAGAVRAALSAMSERLDGYQPFTGDGALGTEQQSISWTGVIIGLVAVLLVMLGGIGLLLFLLRRRGGSRMAMGGGPGYPGYPGYGPGYGGPGYGSGIGMGGAAGIGLGGAAVGGIVGYDLGRSQGGDDASAGSVAGGGGGWSGRDDASAGSVGGGGGDWGGGGGGDSGGGGGGGGDSGGGGGGGGGDS